VQKSDGACFVYAPREGEFVQQKGTRPEYDSYSAFMDDGGVHTGLDQHMKDAVKLKKNVYTKEKIYIYCIQFNSIHISIPPPTACSSVKRRPEKLNIAH
jgi:hypothetical protein